MGLTQNVVTLYTTLNHVFAGYGYIETRISLCEKGRFGRIK